MELHYVIILIEMDARDSQGVPGVPWDHLGLPRHAPGTPPGRAGSPWGLSETHHGPKQLQNLYKLKIAMGMDVLMELQEPLPQRIGISNLIQIRHWIK